VVFKPYCRDCFSWHWPHEAHVDGAPFYGAECPSYPNCEGGCDLGCIKKIERRRAIQYHYGSPDRYVSGTDEPRTAAGSLD
jgi:hypothetical protein